MLTDTETAILRVQVRLGIVYPSVVVLYFLFFFISAKLGTEPSWLFYFPVSIHSMLTCIWLPRAWRYLHRLKGEEKEEFMRLYRYLRDCSKEDDIVEIAITIDNMATLIDGEYNTVSEFVFRYAGKFFIGVKHELLQIPDSKILIDTLYVLSADIEELPEYLSCEAYWLRDAASRRLEELQGTAQ